MSEDALKEYLAIGDPDSLTFIERDVYKRQIHDHL